MRILYVITCLGMGGAENQLAALADKMVDSGHDVEIISLTGETIVRPVHSSIKIHEMNVSKSPLSFIKAASRAIGIIKKFKPDVVHAHMVHANLFCRFVRLLCPIKRLVCTAHSNNEGGAARMFLYRITNFLGDYFTNVSDAAVTAFINIKAANKKQIFCVPNGIDTDKFQFSPLKRNDIRKEFGLSNEQKVIVAVGRIVREKGYDILLKAIKLALDKNEKLHLLIVGDGPLRSEMENFVASHGISQHVTFCGIRNDVSGFMSASDLFVLASRFEGFGLVAAEAMSCQLPVVATDCGGVKEVVGKHGVLVPVEDNKALALAILNSIEVSPKFETEAFRKHILDNYSLNHIVSIWLNIYEGKYIV
ncbi:glycosyltransferase [Photobacterium sanguinicancri]|uniref:glycosyltransferase n=1 Tax=Photobacterium sanguinicancri TaxID=875932 RepID=UPI0021C32026|nr:glycosyltransferase [Photobacterium sanguinicancri]